MKSRSDLPGIVLGVNLGSGDHSVVHTRDRIICVVPEGGTIFMDRFHRGVVIMHPTNPPVLFRFADGVEERLSAAEAAEAIDPCAYPPPGGKP